METKKLYRSKYDRIIAGVAGGLAEYFETDSTVLRIIFVLLTFAGGSGVIIYIVLWMIIPEQVSEKKMHDHDPGHGQQQGPNHEPHDHDHGHDRRDLYRSHYHVGVGGFVLIIVGLILLVNNLFPDYSFDKYWPLILIFIGAAIMFRRRP